MTSRPSLLAALLVITLTRANIIFHFVQPSCNPASVGYTGCLAGQSCLQNGSCIAHRLHARQGHTRYSVDGRCGPLQDGSNILCDPDSKAYRGSCCSQHGWCGSGDAYCGQGCLAGCDSVQGSPTTAHQTQIASNVAANSEPVVGQGVSKTAALSEPTGLTMTSDGTCGALNQGTVCSNWPRGSCCSMYGYCGNTTAHCGDGCQSGPCVGQAATPAPGPALAPLAQIPGSFEVIGQSGVPAMHAALMENGRLAFLDKVENYTQTKLLDGQYAYSSEFDPASPESAALALRYETNAFCSGGSFLADGRLLNIGGNAPLSFIDPTVGDGFTGLRYLQRSASNATFNGESWSEPGNKLDSARWYASAQTMPDGTVFVASGSLNGLDPAVTANNNPTYEILDRDGISQGHSVPMDILVKNQPYYMYPFIHLLRDGTLFVFVSKSSEIFDAGSSSTITSLPDLPGQYRTYPSTGGSVILPFSRANNYNPDVLVCGGGAYQALNSPTDPSCGRINPLSAHPQWEMEAMPEGRVMVEGTLLPDGTVVWLNGGSEGAQGFGLAAAPATNALLYDATRPVGQRFTQAASSTVPRLYHSVALLALDGTVIVTGSNPVEQPILIPNAANPYVTEFRVERFTPPYLSGDNANRRPTNVRLSSKQLIANGSRFTVACTTSQPGRRMSIVLYHGGFVTHSLHMGQRMIELDFAGYNAGALEHVLTVAMPPNNNVAPPGPYIVFVLQDGVPAHGQFVSVS